MINGAIAPIIDRRDTAARPATGTGQRGRPAAGGVYLHHLVPVCRRRLDLRVRAHTTTGTRMIPKLQAARAELAADALEARSFSETGGELRCWRPRRSQNPQTIGAISQQPGHPQFLGCSEYVLSLPPAPWRHRNNREKQPGHERKRRPGHAQFLGFSEQQPRHA